MKKPDSFSSPDFGEGEFDDAKDALDALHAASGALSGDMRYISRNAALKKELLADPEIQQQLAEFREAVDVARAIVSKIFRLISERLAHSQSNLSPFELGISGTQSKKISKQQRAQMMAEMQKYLEKIAHWPMSNQFKKWTAPHAQELLDVNKELLDYCLDDGKIFKELMTYTLITQCGTDVYTMKTEVARITSGGDPQGEIVMYREAAGRAVDFLQNALTPFIEGANYQEEISKKFALQNIAHLTNVAEEIEQGG